MANRMVLNETSYIGAGAIASIVEEAKNRGFSRHWSLLTKTW